ncbi:MAG: TonB family protein [Burkholderiaceae bacterium]|jgi:protein TonB|nr:TonB family protein [Burkholderiaceae bacterium]MEB2353386.1 TonB family protein [Burkholderiaceae bacterium]
MTGLAHAAGVPAPGPRLTDWLASAVLHIAAALALWPLAASVGPASPALQRIELPIRWTADAVVPDERAEPAKAAVVVRPAPSAVPTPQPAEPVRSVETRSPVDARQPADRAPVRRRVVAPSPESATRTVPKKPAETPAIAPPESSIRGEAAPPVAVAQPATTGNDAQLRGVPDTGSVAIREPPVAAQPAPAVAASTVVASAAAAATTRPDTPDPGARRRWRSRLERLMREHKQYPMQARRMRQQGVVTVEARFSADGELLRCDVAGSSGFRSLDEAALTLVRTAAEALRAHHGPGELAELRIPIAYELSGS